MDGSAAAREFRITSLCSPGQARDRAGVTGGKTAVTLGGDKPGKTPKPGIVREFSEPGKLMEFSGILCNLRQIITDKIVWYDQIFA